MIFILFGLLCLCAAVGYVAIRQRMEKLADKVREYKYDASVASALRGRIQKLEFSLETIRIDLRKAVPNAASSIIHYHGGS